MSRIVLLHTNDIHGHLTPWHAWEGSLKGRAIGGLDCLAAAVAAVRKECRNEVLLLDAGDLIGDTMIADLTQGRALIEMINHIGYDAWTIGNHEPDFGTRILRQRIRETKGAVVACNLAEKTDGKLLVRPFVVHTVNKVVVGILGLAYPKTAWTTAAKHVAELEFQEPVAATRRHLPALQRAGAQLIVVLSHLGLSGDQHLAREVKGIHVIVGGHSHNRMEEALEVGQTLIVQAGAHGSDLGRLDLTFERGRITATKRTLLPLDRGILGVDPEAARRIAAILAPHQKQLDAVVGRARDWLVRAQTVAGQEARKRDAESPVDSLFADILRTETRADLAFLPGVGYGVAIPPGPITAAQLRQLVPHDGKVVTMRLPGTAVLEVLEQAVENTFSSDPAVKVGGMVQVSGIRFRYNPSRARGHRILSVERTEGKWDPAATYTVAVPALLAEGGHHYRAFRRGEKRVERGAPYPLIQAWFTRHSPITTPVPGRVVQVKE